MPGAAGAGKRRRAGLHRIFHKTVQTMRHYRIASIPADGIGPEVIAAGLEALEAVAARDGGFQLQVDALDWGSDRYRRTGALMPADGLKRLRGADAILFGAVGAPDIPDHVTLWGLRLPICQGFDQYANVRPTRILPGVTSPLRGVGPGDLDWLIVRENSEGEYAGHGGRAHRGHPEEVATETAIFTRRGVERIMRFAFDAARKRPRKLLTVVTKSNAQRHGMVFWDEIAALVAADYPDVTWDKELVDAMTTRMVRGGAGRVARHRAHRQRRSGAPLPQHVRADPRQRLRHHRQGHRQPRRDLLDRVDDAGPSGRGGRRSTADARGRAGLR